MAVRRLGLVTLAFGLAAAPALATDVAITGRTLIVLDKTVSTGRAKAVFVATDPLVTKGTGTTASQIEATLLIAYNSVGNNSVSGAFLMPQGANWLTNSASLGKYLNNAAPSGGAVRVRVIKPAALVKVVAKSVGDTPLDISSPPSGPVYVVDTIVNGGEETRLCTQFTGCVHSLIAATTGYKLVCRESSGDPACTAALLSSTSTTTTTSSSTSTTTSTSTSTTTTVTFPPGCVSTSGQFCDLGDGTVFDKFTALQWEKKTTPAGSGVNGADLHDVDNTYRWAGTCTVATSKYCQLNLAAEVACKAQTPAAYWAHGCEQCTGGEGMCTVASPAITTVWEWVSQLKAANFAGHDDWRLASEDGRNTSPTTNPRELETILLAPYPCGPSPCIPPIFGPTAPGVTFYWSAATYAANPNYSWVVGFDRGNVTGIGKVGRLYVRGVRGG